METKPWDAHTRIYSRRVHGALVWHSMVCVVLALPPVHRESLEDVAEEKPKCIVHAAIIEDLVMKEIMSQPSRLLPCKAQQEG